MMLLGILASTGAATLVWLAVPLVLVLPSVAAAWLVHRRDLRATGPALVPAPAVMAPVVEEQQFQLVA